VARAPSAQPDVDSVIRSMRFSALPQLWAMSVALEARAKRCRIAGRPYQHTDAFEVRALRSSAVRQALQLAGRARDRRPPVDDRAATPLTLSWIAWSRGSSCWIRNSLRAAAPSNSVMCRVTVNLWVGAEPPSPLTGAPAPSRHIYLRGIAPLGLMRP